MCPLDRIGEGSAELLPGASGKDQFQTAGKSGDGMPSIFPEEQLHLVPLAEHVRMRSTISGALAGHPVGRWIIFGALSTIPNTGRPLFEHFLTIFILFKMKKYLRTKKYHLYLK